MIFEEKDKIVNSASMNSSTLNSAISFVKHHLKNLGSSLKNLLLSKTSADCLPSSKIFRRQSLRLQLHSVKEKYFY
jgi:hypothetical protein